MRHVGEWRALGLPFFARNAEDNGKVLFHRRAVLPFCSAPCTPLVVDETNYAGWQNVDCSMHIVGYGALTSFFSSPPAPPVVN